MSNILLAVVALSGILAPRQEVEPSHLYALAIEHLLRTPGEHDFVVLAAPPAGRPQVRARLASGPARAATAADARRVNARLAQQGFRSRRGAGAQLKLTLGELRLEPAQNATFARLVVEVASSAGGGEALEFLLKKERGVWRVLKAEVEGSIGALEPRRDPRPAVAD